MKIRAVLVFLVMLSILGWFSISCSRGRQLVGSWNANTGCGPISITFYKDGTGIFTSFGEGKSFEWRVEGNELVTADQRGRIRRMRFELKEGTLILDTPDGPIAFFRVR